MRVGLLVVAILLYCGSSYGQSKGLVVNEDEAKKYAKKFKDDDVLMESSYQFFTFDKGKNDLGDKVVSIEENAEYIYSSMKKFSSATHGEFYNVLLG